MRLLRGLWFLLNRDRLEQELEEEMRAHRERMTEEDRRRFGNLLRLREQARDEWGWTWVDGLSRDIRYALRMMRRSPTFTTFVIFVLALGIGVNTALFSVAYPLFIRPLPFPDSSRLYRLSYFVPSQKTELAWMPDLRFWQESATSFESIAGASWGVLERSGDDQDWVYQAAVSADFFRTLGVKPILGRDFLREEDKLDAGAYLDGVTVISYDFWHTEFGGDPAVVGRKLSFKIGGEIPVRFTVVGVMPEGFLFPDVPDLGMWTLLQPREAFGRQHDGGIPMPDVIARLKPGVTPQAAEAELEHLRQVRVRDDSRRYGDASVRITPLNEFMTARVKTMVVVLTGTVGLLLIMTCANVASMMMSRVVRRMHEVAVRAALGAGRSSIIRQLLTEGFVLSLIGSGIGLVVAHWSVQLFVRLSPIEIPRRHELGLSVPVFLCAAVLCALVTLLFSTGPAAWLTRHGSDAESWLAGRRSVSGGRGAFRIMKTSIAVQAAVCLVLVVGTGLLVKTMSKLTQVDPGFTGDHVVSVMLLPPRANRGALLPDFAMRAIQKLERMPGIHAVGGTSHFPVVTRGWWRETVISESPATNGRSAEFPVELRVVTPDFFRAMNIAQLSGRSFTWHDDANSERVALVSRNLAERIWRGEDPVGRSIRSVKAPDDHPMTVVGVVADVNDMGIDTPPPDTIYRPIGQRGWSNTTLFVHAAGDPAELVNRVRAELLADAPPGTRLRRIQTVSEALRKGSAPRRFNMVLLASFAAFAWLLSAIGIYGTVAYSIAQRTREIGLRIALGARPRDILRGLLAWVFTPAVFGLAAGVPLAPALSSYLRSLLFAVSPTDFATILVSAVLLLITAVLAAFIPGRKALSIDPIAALRTE
jgi:putative ABC transport system permease protein